jgi:UDP-N-acetylmuramoyl-tripeptide--D-alanyl-D-alanine ligase
MNFWEPENVRATVGGTWVAHPRECVPVIGLGTDTRALQPGQAFLAIAGEHFDGNTLVAQAAAAGSPLAIIDRPDSLPKALPAGLGVIRVADSRRALLRLAAAYRQILGQTKVIGVAGSNGKTTTVRLIDAVLAGAMRGTASVKSFNNEIGVPLTILGAKPGDGYLICEVGTNSPGEVARLSEAVSPDIAVITSIGREHLEKLGSIEGVAREEAAILEHVRRGGAGIYNADAPVLTQIIPSLPTRPTVLIGFGTSEAADLRVSGVEQRFDELEFFVNGRVRFSLPLLGAHNALNAAAAIAVARRLGIGDEQIRTGLNAVRGPEMRLERREVGGIRMLNDAYNANPDSMRAGIQTLLDLGADATRRVAVLGDMLELGEHTQPEHERIADLLKSSKGIDLVIFVGENMRFAHDQMPGHRSVWFAAMDAPAATEIASLLRPGDLVLLKGSRRMRLERLVDTLGNTAGARTGRIASART